MPAGDTVDAAWKAELRSTALGSGGNNWWFDGRRGVNPIDGWDYVVKAIDENLEQGDGDYAGADRRAAMLLSLNLVSWGLAATVGARYKTLRETTWAKSTTDLRLYLWVPGEGKCYVDGRPRGVRGAGVGTNIVRVSLIFRVSNPVITYV